MENASKALIIAGAILLAILLISLGIFIFSQAQDIVTNSGMTQAEVSAFNSKFTKYEGNTIKGSTVRTMIQDVIANNADDNSTSNGRTISVVIKSGGKSTSYASDKISSTGISNAKSYDVTITKYTKGCVSEITVTEK